jgi:lipid-binding SYLF domain-containing protein
MPTFCPWSQSRGIFGGLSLQGGTLRADDHGNKALSGQKESKKGILTGKIKDPSEAASFLEQITKYGGESMPA